MYRIHNTFAASLSAMIVAASAGHVSDVRAATTLQVTNCGDSGPGSLRDSVAAASSGDTVDLRNLSCRRITLTSGAIAIPQASLAIRGAGFDRMVVSGSYTSSVLRHSGTGTLAVSGMTISQGHLASEEAHGGCLYSAGNADLVSVQVQHCGVYGNSHALDGGAYVVGNLRLYTSAVNYNIAAAGAGLYVGGHLRAHRVRIMSNYARGYLGTGGGFRVLNGATITYATVAGNWAAQRSGGGEILGTQGGSTYIANSTFFNNSAGEQIGALATSNNGTIIINSTFSGNSSTYISTAQITPPATVVNSTFAFNNEHSGTLHCFAAVLAFGEIHMESTIVARNTCNGGPGWDINGVGLDQGSVVGADNLIELAFIPIPADTIRVDPQLLPLADNGGPTLTHALMEGSPAIDRGNDILGLADDQRGPGFARVNGPRADVGAFER